MSKKIRIMLDCESLSTKPNAALLSLSSVAFNLEAKNQHDLFVGEFDTHILIDDAFANGDVDPQTVLWWMKQDEGARRAIISGQAKALPEDVALRDFNSWIMRMTGDENPDDVEIWSNDELADALWVQNAMARHNIAPAWPWWGVRCFRTINSLYPGFRGATKFDGTPHIGVDDARHQAKVLWRIINEGMAGCTSLVLGGEE
ncbi:hypothetical protein MA11_gp36 [Pectobacterium phage MA11]|uniref:hypothetical protein n=1 Tax=Pectobacterium phage MA11 TaxID=2662283 RepID=UPI0012A94FEC|nr:hypothetical protein JT356_gp36 [Pectobacterium phage MA11]QGF21061.1 hypothetical protein MA11_gp36 [Pectobacterium phage MA11]